MHPVMERLHEDHRNVARLLDFMDEHLTGETLNDIVLHEIMLYLVQYPDAFHHPRENRVFERLLMRDASMREPIRKLENEHQQLAATGIKLEQQLRERLSGQNIPAEETCRLLSEYIDLHRKHMYLEESTALPMAKLLLTDADWRAIETDIRWREDPMFGPAADQSYQTVINVIRNQS